MQSPHESATLRSEPEARPPQPAAATGNPRPRMPVVVTVVLVVVGCAVVMLGLLSWPTASGRGSLEATAGCGWLKSCGSLGWRETG